MNAAASLPKRFGVVFAAALIPGVAISAPPEDLLQALTQAGGPSAASLVETAPAPPRGDLPNLRSYLDQLDAYVARLKLQRMRIQPTAGADAFVARMAAELGGAIQDLAQASADLRSGADELNDAVDRIVAANREVEKVVDEPIAQAQKKEADCSLSVMNAVGRMDAGDAEARAPASDPVAVADLTNKKQPDVSAVESQESALGRIETGPLRRAREDATRAGAKFEAASVIQAGISKHAAAVGMLEASAHARLGGAPAAGKNPSQLGIERADQARNLGVSAARRARGKVDEARMAALNALAAAREADRKTLAAKQPNLEAAKAAKSAHDQIQRDQRQWSAAPPPPDPTGSAQRAAACADAAGALAKAEARKETPVDPNAAAKDAIAQADDRLKRGACGKEKLAAEAVPWRDLGGGPSVCGSASSPAQAPGVPSQNAGLVQPPGSFSDDKDLLLQAPSGPGSAAAIAPAKPETQNQASPPAAMPMTPPTSMTPADSGDSQDKKKSKKPQPRGTTDGSVQVSGDTPQDLGNPPPQGGPVGGAPDASSGN